MRAKFVNEDVKDFLKPKTEDEIFNSISKNYYHLIYEKM